MDVWIFGAHGLFWAPFLVRALFRRRPAAVGPSFASRHSALLLAFHSYAFAVFYFAIGRAVLSPDGVPERLAGQRWIGGGLMLVALALAVWALAVFRSWRLGAQVDAGHELCTSGPFRFLRHPIYAALDLLALGSAAWIPDWPVAAGVILIALGGDWRARAEEKVLRQAFGSRYAEYAAKTRRLIPWLY